MAESLPRYQHPGVLLGEVPNYDYAHIKEGVRGSAQLYDSLNRLSEWAFSQAAEEAKARGEQYGAENPVTTQQLLDGTANFADPKSIHGKAARGIQLDTLTTDLEIDASTRLAGLKARAEAGEIDVAGAAAEIRDMQDGYSSALARVDPKASNKFRGNVATAGNSVLLAIQASAGKKATEDQKIVVDGWIDGPLSDMVRAAIEAGDTVDPTTGATITPKQRIDVYRSTLRGAITSIRDADFGRLASKRFEEVVTRAQVNVMSQYAVSDEYIRGDPSGAYTRLQQGDLGRYSSAYRDLPEKERENVRTNFQQETARGSAFAKQREKDAEEAVKRDIYNDLSRYWTMVDGKEKNALRAQIVAKGSGVITFDQLKTLLEPKKVGTGEERENVALEIRAEELIRRGGVTDLAQLAQRVPGLVPKQMRRLQDIVYNSGDRELAAGIRAIAGIPDGPYNPTGAEKDRWLKLQDEAAKIKEEAIKRDGSFDPRVVLGQLRQRQNEITKNNVADESRKALADYAKKGKLAQIPENASEADLARIMDEGTLGFGKKPVFDANAIREILRHLRIIRGE